jgi:hypothetical protein
MNAVLFTRYLCVECKRFVDKDWVQKEMRAGKEIDELCCYHCKNCGIIETETPKRRSGTICALK